MGPQDILHFAKYPKISSDSGCFLPQALVTGQSLNRTQGYKSLGSIYQSKDLAMERTWQGLPDRLVFETGDSLKKIIPWLILRPPGCAPGLSWVINLSLQHWQS